MKNVFERNKKHFRRRLSLLYFGVHGNLRYDSAHRTKMDKFSNRTRSTEGKKGGILWSFFGRVCSGGWMPQAHIIANEVLAR